MEDMSKLTSLMLNQMAVMLFTKDCHFNPQGSLCKIKTNGSVVRWQILLYQLSDGSLVNSGVAVVF